MDLRLATPMAECPEMLSPIRFDSSVESRVGGPAMDLGGSTNHLGSQEVFNWLF